MLKLNTHENKLYLIKVLNYIKNNSKHDLHGKISTLNLLIFLHTFLETAGVTNTLKSKDN